MFSRPRAQHTAIVDLGSTWSESHSYGLIYFKRPTHSTEAVCTYCGQYVYRMLAGHYVFDKQSQWLSRVHGARFLVEALAGS